MGVTYDVTSTLRANDGGHTPIVLVEGLDLWNDITTGGGVNNIAGSTERPTSSAVRTGG